MRIDDALRACKDNHTDLVTIYDKEWNTEQAKLLVNGSNNCSLIGANGCTWSDGEPVTFINLSRIFTEEKCCGALTTGGKWECVNCTSRMYFMCYKKKERFIHVSPVYATWEQALDHCDKKFAGLLRFESEDDQTETERELKRQNISGPVWVGLRQSRLFGFWIWSNGLYVGNWIKWKGGSPPEHQMSQHCGALEKRVNDTFELSDKDCRSEFRFLCEVNALLNEITSSDGMVLKTEYLSSAFHTSTAKSRLRQFYIGVKDVNRTVAETECKTHYTDLVTVYDHQDNMELNSLLINAIDSPSGWIGAYRGSRSKKWSNGDDVTYNQDFNMDRWETCCAAMKADGEWEPFECSNTKYFMCYKQGKKKIFEIFHSPSVVSLRRYIWELA
ncbi:Secretory phospholipase A2 receptor [Labeo rohita]|uniref:Secretory phospholipase A2 receptor n=1 Tax=Labeo rohita TaxID=84645 RepID=A0ABQ8L6L6_LABRO|nr:Secretory phospholipase A2 receptor [Labeo rohita]